MFFRRPVLNASLLLSTTIVIACAADAGDALHVDGGTGPGTGIVDSGIPDTGTGTNPDLDSGTQPEFDSGTTTTTPPPGQDSGTTTTPPQDSGTTTPDDSGSTMTPDTGTTTIPTGCAAGVTVLMATPANSNVALGTADAVCVAFMGSLKQGWGGYNMAGRTITLTGSTTAGPIMPDSTGNVSNPPVVSPGADGFIYWNISAGSSQYAGLSLF